MEPRLRADLGGCECGIAGMIRIALSRRAGPGAGPGRGPGPGRLKFTIDAAPPTGDLRAELVGRTLLYWWPADGWQRGTVARLCPRGAVSHVVAYTRQTSALPGSGGGTGIRPSGLLGLAGPARGSGAPTDSESGSGAPTESKSVSVSPQITQAEDTTVAEPGQGCRTRLPWTAGGPLPLRLNHDYRDGESRRLPIRRVGAGLSLAGAGVTVTGAVIVMIRSS